MTREPNEPNSASDRIDELVNAEIDGVITPAESAELAALLAANPEARGSREQLRELVGVLAQVEALEPPEALHRELLAVFPVRGVPATRPGFLSRLREAWTRRRVLVYGYGLAAILLLAFVGREFMSPVATVGEDDGLTGTMAPKDSRPTANQPSNPDRIDFDRPDLAGSIRLVRRPEEVLVRIDATSDNPLVLVLRYDEAVLTFNEVQRSDGLVASAETAPGQVSLGGEAAAGVRSHAYEIRLSETGGNGATTVQFAFLDAGDPVFEGSLALDAAGGDPAHDGRE